ncbi:helix-turn-helix domain-containing protein [Streptacidiphilus sp. ASG 303]|uniref:helix-turn-helix domain-containing protein n=1 Tax=Streptacidiphilus sp. ASG 303 TaxID=2896847 RepID=UPI001E6127BA|nr:helix-turn-helix domain-containing protein [Streptacidiphilus sp. ASG 303]MCD0482229.1 helix-turn-helix domain-containing protein [Streptacidiphilus sp. ASG 303]
MHLHFIRPARYLQAPHDIVRHPRLNGTATKLLLMALSLPPGTRETFQTLASRIPEGRSAVATARRQLIDEGFLHVRRRQDPRTGTWATDTLVSSVPLHEPGAIAAAWAAADGTGDGGGDGSGGGSGAPGPGSPGAGRVGGGPAGRAARAARPASPTRRIPAVGSAAGRAVGTSPKGDHTGDGKKTLPPRPPAAPPATTAPAVVPPAGAAAPPESAGTAISPVAAPEAATDAGATDADAPDVPGVALATGTGPEEVPPAARAARMLLRAVEDEPRLRLGVAEVLRLAPLAALWLERGATLGDLRLALLPGLPAVVHSAAALVRSRLERKLPPPPVDAPPPPVRHECAECGVPVPRPGLCRPCAAPPHAAPAVAPGPDRPAAQIAAEGAARVRSLLAPAGGNRLRRTRFVLAYR